MPLGTVAVLNLMKVAPNDYEKYEKSRIKTFKPDHQRMVDAGQRQLGTNESYVSCWQRSILHITADMYTDYKQLFTQNTNNITPTAAQQKNAQMV
jgi:hypothetical protein